MGAGLHAAGKPALEQAVDLAHLAPGGDFAVDSAEGGQHVLAHTTWSSDSIAVRICPI